MGTRAVTKIEGLVNLYTHSDGYPSGYGMDLAEFLTGMTITEGTSLSINAPANLRLANGAGCLAAQMVAHFKKGPGTFYLVGDVHSGADYEYHVRVERQEILVKVLAGETRQLFVGTVASFRKFCVEDDS